MGGGCTDRQLAVGSWQLAVSSWQSAVGSWPGGVSFPVSATLDIRQGAVMIENTVQLYASLHQLSCFVDMLDALQRDCAAKSDFRLFSTISVGYFTRIRELNEEIRDYLKKQVEIAAIAGTR